MALEKFYVTFGVQYSYEPHPILDFAHPDGWMLIEAPNYNAARAVTFMIAGDKFSMIYTEEEFPQADIHRFYPRGELAHYVFLRVDTQVDDRPPVVETLDDVVYEKCADCWLFVEKNGSITPGLDPDYADTLAKYVHLHRGDRADTALDESHEASPSGERRTLGGWKQFGPPQMRARFTS
jgi:hypothetical protein